MTRSEAKRHACWLVAEWTAGTRDGGAALHTGREDHPEFDDGGEDEARIANALDELIAELHDRGREPGNPRIDGLRRPVDVAERGEEGT